MTLIKIYKLLISIFILSPALVVAQTPSDGNRWFQLAVESRENGQFSEAYDALGKAEQLGFAPVRIGFERARLHTLTNETDDLGNPCGSYDFAVVKASQDGIATTDQNVDRMIQSLEIARATGLRVRLWVHRCSTAGSSVTYPKAYLVWTAP